MKLTCKQCGCHFPEEFPITLLPPCNLWGDKGLGNLSEELKKKLWDWAFMLPADEIAVAAKVNVLFGFGGVPIVAEEEFEKIVPNWNLMTEEERKQYERDWFKSGGKKPTLKIKGKAIN